MAEKNSLMWSVYYDNGDMLNSQPLKPIGIIAVAVQDKTHNWIFWYGKDWYILQKDGEWMGVDQQGLFDQILNRLEYIESICQGRTLVPFESYQSIIDRMIEDCRPEKTGWHPGEK